MESAPQSTITHNAVIEFASDFDSYPTQHRGSGGRIKRRPALPKRAALNRRDHAKIAPPAQRRGGHNGAISAAICAETRRILEMAVGQARQRYRPALAVQKPWNFAPRDNCADRGHGDPGK